jgi:hypothetical protein
LIHHVVTCITIQIVIYSHWCTNGLGIIHSKLIDYVFDVLALTHKCTTLQLLDLKTKEVTQLSYCGHLKLINHHFSKLFTKILISWSKYDVINIYLQHKQVLANLLGEKSGINLTHHELLWE